VPAVGFVGKVELDKEDSIVGHFRLQEFRVQVSEWLPANKWGALTRGDEDVAEVCLEPEGEAFTFRFRVPRERDLSTVELLSVADVSPGEIEMSLGDDNFPDRG
jgi:hypothetical protein